MEQSLATTQIFNANCLEKMKDLDDDSVDLIFCDLPYGQTSCKWDCCIDLELFWKEVMRIKKLNTPIFFTTTTKFGVSLIQSAPKKCFFRYDLVWVKSAPAGFLSAKKMPMRKHEMIYVFYEKLPFYDLSSHKHKFIKEVANEDYDKREKKVRNTIKKEEVFGKGYLEKKVNFRKFDPTLGGNGAPSHLYDPPLPVSVVKQEEELCKYDVNKNTYGGGKEGRIKIPKDKKYHEAKYDPPLPVSVVKQEDSNIIDGETYNTKNRKKPITREKGDKYDPPLPVSVVKQEKTQISTSHDKDLYGSTNGGTIGNVHGTNYDPPLPTTMLEIKSTRGKHSTEKPVALMEWVFKYYSKEGDVVLDPTMGSGSTGVACKNMNRNFIGIEMDEEIFKVAESRLS